MADNSIQKQPVHYCVMQKHCLQKNNSSWETNGLYTYSLNLPDDRAINLKQWITCATNGYRTVVNALKKLTSTKFITHHSKRSEMEKCVSAKYVVHAFPVAIKADDCVTATTVDSASSAQSKQATINTPTLTELLQVVLMVHL